MKGPGVPASCEVAAFVPTKDGERARLFYENQLGLTFRGDDSFALVFDLNGTTLRVVRIENFTPAPFTILGWEVVDINAVVTQPREAGVVIQNYPWLEQDDSGIWIAPSRTRVAWFTDPDGNVLSVSQGVQL